MYNEVHSYGHIHTQSASYPRSTIPVRPSAGLGIDFSVILFHQFDYFCSCASPGTPTEFNLTWSQTGVVTERMIFQNTNYQLQLWLNHYDICQYSKSFAVQISSLWFLQ